MDKTSGAFWGFYPFDMLYVFPMLLCLDSVLSVRRVIVIYIICAVGLSLFYQKRNYVPCIKLILQGRSFWSITWVNSWNIELFHQPLLMLFTPNLTEPSSLARLFKFGTFSDVTISIILCQFPDRNSAYFQ